MAACATYDMAKSHELFDRRESEALGEDLSLSGWSLEQEMDDAILLAGMERSKVVATVQPAVDGVDGTAEIEGDLLCGDARGVAIAALFGFGFRPESVVVHGLSSGKEGGPKSPLTISRPRPTVQRTRRGTPAHQHA